MGQQARKRKGKEAAEGTKKNINAAIIKKETNAMDTMEEDESMIVAEDGNQDDAGSVSTDGQKSIVLDNEEGNKRGEGSMDVEQDSAAGIEDEEEDMSLEGEDPDDFIEEEVDAGMDLDETGEKTCTGEVEKTVETKSSICGEQSRDDEGERAKNEIAKIVGSTNVDEVSSEEEIETKEEESGEESEGEISTETVASAKDGKDTPCTETEMEEKGSSSPAEDSPPQRMSKVDLLLQGDKEG